MKDLMLDLETLGLEYGSVITQIGACYFDRYSGEIGETFQVNVDIQSCLDLGLKVDAKALIFWFEQTCKKTFLVESVFLRDALESYRAFSSRAESVWSHKVFDFTMLLHVSERLRIEPVNHYKTGRDIRTLMHLANVEKEELLRDDAHIALPDCLHQVKYCVKAFNALRVSEF